MRIADYFDNVYAGSGRFWWRDEGRYELNPDAYPSSLLTQQTLRLLADRSPGWALDIGAGEGTDAIRLALLGYDVDAVEVSKVGVEKIERFAAEAGAGLHIIPSDVLDFVPDKFYDVVVCNGVLHYVEDKQRVIELMQGATQPAGINIISLWSDYTPVPECHQFVPVHADKENGVVTSSYREWRTEFIYFERDKGETSHSDLAPHRHSHIKLIARKP
jgi:SAM-dependent methyltransferase